MALLDFAAERRAPDFAGFIHGAGAEAAVAGAAAAARLEASAYLWGAAGCGKSHLLAAAVRQAEAAGARIMRPGDADPGAGLAVIDGAEALDEAAQAEALRLLDAAVADGGPRVLAAGALPARRLELRADLRTRLEALPAFELPQLDDAALADALVASARRRRRELPEAVAAELVALLPRRMDALAAALDELDLHALEANLRLSPAAVRRWLKERGAA
ncbi:MAG: DnaA regulatory inactivator Hda [Betaproteobacteria bacterium AqS2]|uniref:DnaA regulatory inactivator Hda n=1 Tax=Candidatus Amphirhobacter heronislandensis TaxID=1732024 RepID=A0A930UB58_9GAMM|nr:DnaA regulatory inactivator Hda [Betaproteobacteria bacterium AqS2]